MIKTLIYRLTNSEEKKRLLSNFFSLSVLQAANYILPLITLPYLVRVLGPEKFGLIAFSQAFIAYFNILTDYGFNLSATREISINRDNREKISEIFSSVMIIKLGLLVLSFISMSIIIFTFAKFREDWLIFYLTFGMVVGQVLFPVWFFQGMERMKYITILNITAKLIFTIAIFVFVNDVSDYIYVPLLNSIGFMVAGIMALWIVFKDFGIKLFIPKLKIVWNYFKDSTQFFLSRVSVSIYTSSNAFVLGLFTSNTMVGYYSIAEKMYQALQGIYMPLTQTLYPYVANSKNVKLFKKVFKLTVLANVFLIIMLFLFGGELFSILFTQKFSEVSIKVFNIFLIVALIVVPSILLGYPFLAAMGYPEYANKSVIYGSLIHLVGLVFLAILHIVSPATVVLMVMITEGTVFFMRIYWVRRNILI